MEGALAILSRCFSCSSKELATYANKPFVSPDNYRIWEVPLGSRSSGGGYAILAEGEGDRSLLEISPRGALISYTARAFVSKRLDLSTSEVLAIHYLSPLCLVAEVLCSGQRRYYSIPDGRFIDSHAIPRQALPLPAAESPLDDINYMISYNEIAERRRGIRLAFCPRYAQHRFGESNERLAGCSPVAGAILFAAIKLQLAVQSRYNALTTASRIYRGSDCWFMDWDSFESTLPECSEVQKTIEELHRAFLTTANGSTYVSEYEEGLEEVLERLYDVKSLLFRRTEGRSGKNVISEFVGHDGHPIIISGLSNWGIEDKGRHAAVGYAATKGGRNLLVNLGWGSFFEDKWINVNSIRELNVVSWHERR